jgi:DNA-binding transcriptional regulator YhcF (GntR family)
MTPPLSAATTGDKAAYIGIADDLRARLLAGRFRPNTTLPSARELADEMGCGKDTVAEAYRVLAAEGFILLRDRARPVVQNAEAIRDVRFETLRGKIEAFRAHLTELGYDATEIRAATRGLDQQ